MSGVPAERREIVERAAVTENAIMPVDFAIEAMARGVDRVTAMPGASARGRS